MRVANIAWDQLATDTNVHTRGKLALYCYCQRSCWAKFKAAAAAGEMLKLPPTTAKFSPPSGQILKFIPDYEYTGVYRGVCNRDVMSGVYFIV